MNIWFLLLLLGSGWLIYQLIDTHKQKKAKDKVFDSLVADEDSVQQAVDLTALMDDKSLIARLKSALSATHRRLGDGAHLKILVAALISVVGGVFINNNFFPVGVIQSSLITMVVCFVFIYQWLKKREEKAFNDEFPDALNTMSGAISSGESLMHSVIFVGNNLDGVVGNEFKRMGERLRLGEPPEYVFYKSSERFPYATYLFFVITMNTNISRGGPLKDVIKKLNRQLFNTRAIEKKKLAMTSEARMSAKIVSAIPFIFLFMQKFTNPADYEFVMFHSSGKPILYYVVASVAIGMLVIRGLLSGVK
ncbi:type II secretion system F family protein [Vibrio paucivorans]